MKTHSPLSIFLHVFLLFPSRFSSLHQNSSARKSTIPHADHEVEILASTRKEVKCRSEKPLPSVFSVSFVVIFGGVVVFGHRESVEKL